jgi:beta-glucosidase
VSETGISSDFSEYPTSFTNPSPRPVKLEWFNGNTIGQNLAHSEMMQSVEYMIKEAWPHYLRPEYCSMMCFDLTPKTSGLHTFSVISTGKAAYYIDGKEIFVRQQETYLRLESFYFFKSKLERRFTIPMCAGQRYSVALEA